MEVIKRREMSLGTFPLTLHTASFVPHTQSSHPAFVKEKLKAVTFTFA